MKTVDADRATGRTTGLMLDAMAQASLNRGKWIVFHDHGDQSPEAAIVLQAAMQQMADALGLDYDIGTGSCSVGSDVNVRWPKEQTEPATPKPWSSRQYFDERLSQISTAGAEVPSDMAVLASAVLSILERLDKG